MEIVLKNKLKEYMQEKGKKDIVLFVDMCST